MKNFVHCETCKHLRPIYEKDPGGHYRKIKEGGVCYAQEPGRKNITCGCVAGCTHYEEKMAKVSCTPEELAQLEALIAKYRKALAY